MINSSYSLLDLFCGDGLAAIGYHSTGMFSRIVGVDINSRHRARYPFEFLEADALSLDYEFLSQFDLIHASPPCQAYSKVTPAWARGNHQRLIPATHLLCAASGAPYVIENVPGSSRELRPNIVISGHDVGLSINRPRYFFISWGSENIRTGYTRSLSTGAHIHGGGYVRKEAMRALYRMDDFGAVGESVSLEGMKQGIPPQMTRLIGLSFEPKSAF